MINSCHCVHCGRIHPENRTLGATGRQHENTCGAFWKRAFLSSPSTGSTEYFYIAMAAVKALNPKAEVARAQAALAVNISAARGLQDVLRTNLGPKGTMKM